MEQAYHVTKKLSGKLYNQIQTDKQMARESYQQKGRQTDRQTNDGTHINIEILTHRNTERGKGILGQTQNCGTSY